MNNIFVDFDGCIVNTIKAICDLYNEDFKYYENYIPINWWDIESWSFNECNCASPEYIDTYFNQQRLFDKLTYMDWAKEVLIELNKNHNIFVVSHGNPPNLIAKEIWIKENLPFCHFIGVNLEIFKDKSCIDMNDGIFIDDCESNLVTSNSREKICFGELYQWNKNWNGTRCKNWMDVYEFVNKKGGS